VSSAQTQADSIAATGHADAERELATLCADVDRVQKRRDSLVAQLGALKDIVAGFGDEPLLAAQKKPELAEVSDAGRSSGAPVETGDSQHRTRQGAVSGRVVESPLSS
jgi:hypothetical protein